jgi:hypothetical protein
MVWMRGLVSELADCNNCALRAYGRLTNSLDNGSSAFAFPWDLNFRIAREAVCCY